MRVDQIIAYHAVQRPDQLALTLGPHALSYAQLDKRARQVANGLRAPHSSVHRHLLPADFQHRPHLEGGIDLAIGTASNNPIKLSRELLFRDEICGIVRSGHP